MELSKGRLAVYSSLGQVKMRRRHRLFSVEGEKAVTDTLESFSPEAIICADEYHPSREMLHCDQIYQVSNPVMKRLSNLATPSPVMGVFHLPEETECDYMELSQPDGLYVALDGVQDPGNMGTIIRTCHWFGIFDIFASRDTVDIFNPKTIQATMGSLGKVRVHYVDLKSLFESNQQLPVYGMLLDGKNMFETSLERRGFILLGNEGKGVSPNLRNCITHPLLIPPAGPDHSESLNVAVAGAITIAWFVR